MSSSLVWYVPSKRNSFSCNLNLRNALINEFGDSFVLNKEKIPYLEGLAVGYPEAQKLITLINLYNEIEMHIEY